MVPRARAPGRGNSAAGGAGGGNEGAEHGLVRRTKAAMDMVLAYGNAATKCGCFAWRLHPMLVALAS